MVFLIASLAWAVVAGLWVWTYRQVRREELAEFRTKVGRDANSREIVARIEAEAAGQHEAAETERVQLTLANALEIAHLQRPAKLPPPKPASRDIQLPDDLEAHVMTWGDTFAQDDNRGFIRMRYLELHDGDEHSTWQKVRRAVGIGEMPE